MSQSNPQATVVVCTHNPRFEFLARSIQSLANQSLSKTEWELLIIDNCSVNAVVTQVDLKWHPLARVINEKQLGLTNARRRGIESAKGELIIFVDDDNVIHNDYLARTVEIGRNYPHLDGWGAGRILPAFALPPSPAVNPYLSWLGLRYLDREYWTNVPRPVAEWPIGAGLCVRSAAARHYVTQLAHNAARRGLDRRGTLLGSHGDTDLLLTITMRGAGVGSFPGLELTHLIPGERITEPYLLRLIEDATYSGCILHEMWTGWPGKAPESRVRRLMEALRAFRRRGFSKEVYLAGKRGEERARKDLNAPGQPPRY